MSRQICSWMLLAVVTAVAFAQQSGPRSSSAPKQTAGDAQVQQITLPKYPGEVPPGPNVDVYKKDCLTCHSSRYVAMQPRFPKAVWQSEVKKMVDAYGAPIPEADQAPIVEYLVAVKGVEAPPATSPPAK